jgi:predicted MFS family arabinose efflux permease
MPSFKETFSTGYLDSNYQLGLSPSQSGQIVSILSAGTFFGALGAAPFADKIGRRLSLILAVAVFTFGVILQVIASAIPIFLAGRYVMLSGAMPCCSELTLVQVFRRFRRRNHICACPSISV